MTNPSIKSKTPLILAKTLTYTFLLLLATQLQAKTTLLVLGDSLSAGYGIDIEQGWVHLLQKRLNLQGDFNVINASTSGETTAGGLARLPGLLEKFRPTIVIVELGANDGLRGYAVKLIQRNLTAIAKLNHQAGAQTLILGMQIPPNYGARYTQAFNGIFPAMAQALSLPLVPFFLDHVVLKERWMQIDGIHPSALGQPQLLENIWPFLQPLLTPAT